MTHAAARFSALRMAFIDALGRSAIAPAVCNWILQQACRDAAGWRPRS